MSKSAARGLVAIREAREPERSAIRAGELQYSAALPDVSGHVRICGAIDGTHPVILRRLITHIGGAAAVEFALTAPVFFAIVFGLIDSGLLLWTQLGLQHATELAARCASVNKTICADTMR